MTPEQSPSASMSPSADRARLAKTAAKYLAELQHDLPIIEAREQRKARLERIGYYLFLIWTVISSIAIAILISSLFWPH